MHRLIDDMSSQASGKLAIGASYTFGEYILPRIIAELKERFPDISTVVTISNTSNIADLVRSHQLDVGIVEGSFKEKSELQSEIFAKDRMVVISSPTHTLAQSNEKLSAKQLEKETWILREAGSGTREAAEKVFEKLEFHPSAVMQFSSTQPIKSMVEAGVGISLMSEWAIQKEVYYGDLMSLPIEGSPYLRYYSIVTSSPFRTKALSVFIELLKSDQEFKKTLIENI